MKKQQYLNTAELAQRWGISPVTLRAWRLRGRGPAYQKVGKNARYDIKDVRAYEQKGPDHGSD